MEQHYLYCLLFMRDAQCINGGNGFRDTMYISRLYPGGPRELIKHGENGLLFKVEDVEDLVNQMRLVLNNQVSATSIAKMQKYLSH